MRRKELEKLGCPLIIIRSKRPLGGEELRTRILRSFAVRPMEPIRSCGDKGGSGQRGGRGAGPGDSRTLRGWDRGQCWLYRSRSSGTQEGDNQVAKERLGSKSRCSSKSQHVTETCLGRISTSLGLAQGLLEGPVRNIYTLGQRRFSPSLCACLAE